MLTVTTTDHLANGDPAAGRGPHHHTLRWWVSSLEDTALWQPAGDGLHILRVPKAALAASAGITPGSLTSRLNTLRGAGLLASTNPLIVRSQQLRERLSPTVVSIRRNTTGPLHDELAHAGYQHQPDGGYLRDGRRATVAELAAATGRSTGTVQHHLTRQRAGHDTHPDHRGDHDHLLATIDRLTNLVANSTGHHPAITEQVVRYALAALQLLTETFRGKRDEPIALSAEAAGFVAENPSEFESELNLNSSQTREDPAESRETRGIPTETRGEAVPAANRHPLQPSAQLDEHSFHDRFARPLAETHDRVLPDRPGLVLGPPAFAAAAGWPVELLDIARDRLAADMADHPDLVDNWGGLITVVLREGRTRYLPLELPPTAEDRQRRQVDQQLARWERRLAALQPDDAAALLESTIARQHPELHQQLTQRLALLGDPEPQTTGDWREHLHSAKAKLHDRGAATGS